MAFAGGNGTYENPYQVATAEQLNDVRNYRTSCFLQTANIDLSSYSNWTPIGDAIATCFNGLYDGGNFQITHLACARTEEYAGLFGYLWPNAVNDYSTLKNINVIDAVVSGTTFAGVLMGYGRAKIENCHVSGTLTASAGDNGGLLGSYSGGSSSFVGHIYDCSSSVAVTATGGDIGGIAGYLECFDIQRCSNTGNISGGYNVGGFAGMVSGSDSTWVVKDCYTKGTVTGTSKFAGVYSELGGFAGAWYYQKAENCYSASSVYNNGGGSQVGAFIGDYDNSDAPIVSSYYDTTLCGLSNTTSAVGKTTVELGTVGTYTGWNFSTVWDISGGGSPVLKAVGVAEPVFAGGSGTKENPYFIATAEQLNAVRNHLSSSFMQVANIDLGIYTNWVPLGNDSTSFSGVYDGNGFNITNLKLNSSNSYSGLFGYSIDSSGSVPVFKNVNIVNAYVVGDYATGILLGYGVGILSNCHTSGYVSGTTMIGGLCGEFYDGDGSGVKTYITNCSSTAIVVCSDMGSGGLFGYLQVKDMNKCCHTVGKVTGKYYVGGLAGFIDSYNQEFVVQNCYASGEVESTGSSSGGTFCGGFSGYNALTLKNCYSACTITTINPGLHVSAFLGENGFPEVPIVSCYYDFSLTALSDSSAVIPKSTAEMQSIETFVNWNFTGIWCLPANNYPIFSDGVVHIRTSSLTGGGTLGRCSVSLHTLNGELFRLWNINKKNGEIKLYSALASESYREWYEEATLDSTLLDYCVVLDGYWARYNNRWVLTTEETPYIVYVTATGSLNIKLLGSDIVTNLAEGVTRVNAIRAWKNPNIIENDQGIVVAYMKNDATIYYRNYCIQSDGSTVWETEKVLTYKAGLVANFSLTLLNDYRMAFIIEDTSGNICWNLTNRMWAGLALVPEKIDVSPLASLAFNKVTYKKGYGEEKITVYPITTIAFLYGATGNSIVSVSNVDNGSGDFGRYVQFVIAHESESLPSCVLTDVALGTDIGVTSVIKLSACTYRVITSSELEYGFNTVTGDIRLDVTGAVNPAGTLYNSMTSTFTPTSLVPPYVPPPEVEVIVNE